MGKNEKKYARAKDMIDNGLSVSAACKKAGLPHGSYYWYKKKAGDTPQIKVHNLAPKRKYVKKPKRVFSEKSIVSFVGDEDSVTRASLKALREYNNVE